MDKPHALRLADALDQFHNPWDKEAADELRRLHQSEQEGWRWARECEAEVKRLRELVDSQKPVMWMLSKGQEPPKREWVGLTEEESVQVAGNLGWEIKDAFIAAEAIEFAYAVNVALREKNE
jgi:hypothetical protein